MDFHPCRDFYPFESACSFRTRGKGTTRVPKEIPILDPKASCGDKRRVHHGKSVKQVAQPHDDNRLSDCLHVSHSSGLARFAGVDSKQPWSPPWPCCATGGPDSGQLRLTE